MITYINQIMTNKEEMLKATDVSERLMTIYFNLRASEVDYCIGAYHGSH